MFSAIRFKQLYMGIFVNNLNVCATLYLYYIHQSLIIKSVSLFKIMNALMLLTFWSVILGYMHHACMQIVKLCGFIILNNDIDFIIKLWCI